MNNDPLLFKEILSVGDSLALMHELKALDWVTYEDSPREEYYCSLEKNPTPYTYGRGRGVRTYYPNPFIPESLRSYWSLLNFNYDLPMCFMNYYWNGLKNLGWHSDNSELLDNSKPITIYSLGAEREIWFRPFSNKSDVVKMSLPHNSICIMPAGYQLTHEHRIPKSNFGHLCGGRISLTFRGTKKS